MMRRRRRFPHLFDIRWRLAFLGWSGPCEIKFTPRPHFSHYSLVGSHVPHCLEKHNSRPLFWMKGEMLQLPILVIFMHCSQFPLFLPSLSLSPSSLQLIFRHTAIRLSAIAHLQEREEGRRPTDAASLASLALLATFASEWRRRRRSTKRTDGHAHE